MMATGGAISAAPEESEAGSIPCLTDSTQTLLPNTSNKFTDDPHQSDAVHKYTCSPCSKNDVTTEATHYCPECDVCYCKACLCDHAILGRSKIAQWGKAVKGANGKHTQDDEQEIKCLRHPKYTVTLYCVEHDVLCCKLCNAKMHRLCKNMEKLSAAAKTITIGDSVKQVEDEIASLEINIEALTKNRETSEQFVESSYTCYINQLSEMQDKVNAKFDAVKEDARVRRRNQIDKFSKDKKVCTHITDTLKRYKQTMKHTDDKQERFVKVKWAREWVGKQRDSVECMLNKTFTKVFQKIPGAQEANALDGVTKAILIMMAEMKFSIETTGDKNEGEIVGICQLANENLVIADKANKCLKQLDARYCVISWHNLHDAPRGLCATGDFEVAVATGKEILIVAVATVFENVRTLVFDHLCTGVAYHNEQLFITNTPSCPYNAYCSCTAEIYVYNKTGKLLKQMTADIGVHCRSDSDNGTPLSISEDGEKIYVAHRCGLAVLDSEGRKITSSQDYTSTNIVGFCVDSKGFLYISRRGIAKVLKLSQEGTGGLQNVISVISALDEKTNPGPICYDKRLCRIAICQGKGSYIYLEKQIH